MIRAVRRHVNTSSEMAFRVLQLLSRTDRPLGVADLHRITGEPTSSIHRALITLEESGFASRFDQSTKFGPGPVAYHLVRALIGRFPLRQAALPALRAMVESSDGAAAANVRLGWFSLRVGLSEGRQEYYLQRRLGEARLLHTGAAPLAMLATLDDDEIAQFRAFVAREVPQQAHAALSPSLERAIGGARKRGFLVRPDPMRRGRSWIAFAIRDLGGKAQAAIACSLREEDMAAGEQTPAALRKVAGIVERLQAQVDADPSLLASPYADIPPDQIRLAVATSDAETGELVE